VENNMPHLMLSAAARAGKLRIFPAVVAIVVLALVGGGVVAIRAGGPKALLSHGAAAATPTGEAQPAATPPTATPPSPTEAIELGQFLVNVETTGGLHYLRTDLALEIEAPDAKTGKKAKGEEKGKESSPKLPPAEELRAKDAVVQVLSSARFESLRTGEGREKLKARLLEALTAALPEQKVRGILIVSFVMQ
jgi:flagellar basal body-associated protein FliL